jgi:hypothetical protein
MELTVAELSLVIFTVEETIISWRGNVDDDDYKLLTKMKRNLSAELCRRKAIALKSKRKASIGEHPMEITIQTVEEITIEAVLYNGFTVKRIKITDDTGSNYLIKLFSNDDGAVDKLKFRNLPIRDERGNT